VWALPNRCGAGMAALDAGVAWLKSHAVYGFTFTGDRTVGRRLVPAAGAGPIWARYYSVTTGKPIFGDRNMTIHDDVNELSLERRNGYSWWNNGPERALDAYAEWHKTTASRPGPAPT
jgi:PelA/Pel-15E family pectate lyase